MYYLLFLLYIASAEAAELTFEVPDNSVECFLEDIDKGTKVLLEYQVVTGGQYDIDMKIEGPGKRILFDEKKQQYGQHEFEAETTGTYQVCFSNEFSTFTHKVVYMDYMVGEEPPLPGISAHMTAMTQMETSAQKIHEDMNSIIDFQTHHRLKEAQGRKRAEDLNERVLMWAFGETLGILVVTIGQVMVLKNFFADKKPLTATGY